MTKLLKCLKRSRFQLIRVKHLWKQHLLHWPQTVLSSWESKIRTHYYNLQHSFWMRLMEVAVQQPAVQQKDSPMWCLRSLPQLVWQPFSLVEHWHSHEPITAALVLCHPSKKCHHDLDEFLDASANAVGMKHHPCILFLTTFIQLHHGTQKNSVQHHWMFLLFCSVHQMWN